MAMRSIGSLTVSFGLVAIPVKLYSAVQSANAVSFNLINSHTGSRVKQQYIDAATGVVVERDDMVKGYEYAKDKYVTFTVEEIKSLEEMNTHSVEIGEFVPLQSVDPVYFDKTYFLAPDKGAAKPFALLVNALKDSGRAGVGRWANRGKGHVVMIREANGGLVMQQLHFNSEVRSASELDIPTQEVKPAELKLARQLIDAQTVGSFDPTSYKDEQLARVQAAIQAKVDGGEIPVQTTTQVKVPDLMAALEASLAKGK